MKHSEQLNTGRLETLFITLFLWAMGASLLTYAQSSFLERFVPTSMVGLVFTGASVGLLFALIWNGAVVARFGKRNAAVIAFLFLIASLLVLIYGARDMLPAWAVIAGFFVYVVSVMLAYVGMDMLVESSSTDGQTGRIRGTELTIMSAGGAIAPLGAGFILEQFGYPALFATSTALMILSAIFLRFGMPREPATMAIRSLPIFSTLREIMTRRGLPAIFFLYFLLRFFYVWMVIYTPLHLLAIGLDWIAIGKIFTIMLLPFVLFEYPAGKLADTRFGEKEMLIVGFLVLAGTTTALAFITTPTAWLWALLLFGTRTGASIVQVMCETYFFKTVDRRDVHLIEFFRTTIPLAYIIAPIIASILLLFFPMHTLFFVLGLFLSSGIIISSMLHDTSVV
jgi:MFS family permease